jgi:hypothetical protein
MVGMDRAAARGLKIGAAHLKEIINALPEPTRTEVRKRLIELYNAKKSKK